MCIIIHKPVGATVSKETLKRCFDRNGHGAGFMFVNDGHVWGNKGYMTFKSLIKGLEDAGFYEDGQLIDKYAVTVHFRLASHGKICPANCHPFQVSDDLESLTANYWEADVGLAHNGIIDIPVIPGISDTMTFIKEVFSDPKVYENMSCPAIYSLVSKAVGGSRLAILYGTGEIIFTGNWVEEDGVFYSNYSFQGAPTTTHIPKKKISEFISKANEKAGMADKKKLPPPGMKWA